MVNHGANLYELSEKYDFSKEELIDFSSNINPLGVSEIAKKHLIKNIDLVSIYPDTNYNSLKKSISNYCNCRSENIILGSGATELISSFTKTTKPKKSLILYPTYSEYENELKKINCDIYRLISKKENDFKIDIDYLIKDINKNNYELVIICNPNNPTGFTFDNTQIEKILKNTNSLIMIDETYIEFTDTKIFSSTNLVDKYDKLFVIRGTSKFFSTPGIRLGYGLLSNKVLKEKINLKTDLWNINIFASIMGEVMFNDYNYINNVFNFIEKERTYLKNNLRNIKDLKVYDSSGNFILCEIKSKKITAKILRDNLIKEKIVIRDCSSFDGLDEFFFRVCILSSDNNKLLIKNLYSIFSHI